MTIKSVVLSGTTKALTLVRPVYTSCVLGKLRLDQQLGRQAGFGVGLGGWLVGAALKPWLGG
jgi:hypothetical protein